MLLVAAGLVALVAPPARGAVISHEFTNSGVWSVPAEAVEIDVLAVGGGGGGGGGGSFGSGGGGGGGAVNVCTDIAVTAGQTLTATVGSGGLFTAGYTNGTPGDPSSLALGVAPICQANGGQGGLGDGLGTPSGGNSGNGNPGGATTFVYAAGGGAGAGAAGGDSTSPPNVGGAGGSGVAPASLTTPGLFASLTCTFYGGGGGGGYSTGVGGSAGPGGTGGGGAGAPSPASRAGAANTGGGGGGGSGLGAGGSGGSGYLLIRYEPRATNYTPPVVSGSGLVGETVSTTSGSWNYDPTSYAYSWQRCDQAGTGCADIDGATSSSYTVVDADVGKYLRSRVTGTNAIGGLAAFSSNALLARSPSPNTPNPPEPPGPTPTPKPTATVSLPRAKVTRTSVLVTSAVTVSGKGKIAQSATASKGRNTKTWCRASESVGNAGTHKVKCNLGRKGRSALRKKALKLTLRTTFTLTTGDAVTVDRKLTLKRKR